MNPIKDFSIPFVGLKPGKHIFNYEVKDSFFEYFQYSPVKKGNLTVEVEFDKQQENRFMLYMHFSGWVELICDRCNEPYQQEINADNKEIVKLGGSEEESDDDIMVLPKTAFEINIAELLYEFIIINCPMFPLHPLDEKGKPDCSKEMEELLKKLYIENPEKELKDPRWDILKNIK